MSSDLAIPSQGASIIQAHDLGKCYKIYDNPKARLKQALWRRNKQYYREFWALRNVNFEVKRGESLGIIGRNGSGKSTLLQLICGTLTPTEGKLSTQGRIAAILELGSGFNPEFTGLENVYLNASLHGLSKEQTEREIDHILAFADIGEFIHQPVKAYSSGMAVRLAFAVIAHVNADILVVDEALAVGDAIFIQRCMRFIRRMREEGCLLFVSHDAEAVKSLCSHALWLSQGFTKTYGKCRDVASSYLQFCHATSYVEEITIAPIDGIASNATGAEQEEIDHNQPEHGEDSANLDYQVKGTFLSTLNEATGWGTGDAHLLELSIEPVGLNKDSKILNGGEEIEIQILARTNKILKKPILGFLLANNLGQYLFGENTVYHKDYDSRAQANPGDKVKATFRLLLPMLPSGTYAVTAAIGDGDIDSNIIHQWIDNAGFIVVSSSKIRYCLVGASISEISLEILS